MKSSCFIIIFNNSFFLLTFLCANCCPFAIKINFFNQNVGLQDGRQHWQWQAVDPVDGEEYFMLNTDFELFFELDLDGDGKTMCILDNTCVHRHTCGRDGLCPKAATVDQALSYAHVSIVLLYKFPIQF